MVCSAVLFVTTVIFVVSGATAPHCSGIQSPNTVSISGDGVVDLSEVTTLQYCINDNCTIVRTDTGQQLDIIYTTDSQIVVTPKDSQTATMVIARMDTEPVCAKPNSRVDIITKRSYTFVTLIVAIVVTMSTYNIIVHLVYKKLLHNPIGKLLTLNSFFLVFRFITAFLLMTSNFTITVDSVMVCYSIIIAFMMSYIGFEAVATCILSHIAYAMYQSHKMYRVSDDNNKSQFQCYTAYISIMVIVSLLLISTYDLATGNWSDTMLANGRCVHLNQTTYGTMSLMFAITGINKILQLTTFVIYLFYCYKLKNTYHNETTSNRKKYQKLFRIAIAMGATIGISQIIFILNNITGSSLISAERIGIIALLIQQCILVMSFRWIKMVYKVVCKKL